MYLILLFLRIVRIAGFIIMDKNYCGENPYWWESLKETGIKNVCSICCENYKECGGLIK